MTGDAAASNRLALTGKLTARDALRYTPAGVPIVTFAVAHGSRQSEAGGERQVDLVIACVAVEEIARVIAAAPLGTGLALRGFLAPKGKSSRQLALHVTDIEFEERK